MSGCLDEPARHSRRGSRGHHAVTGKTRRNSSGARAMARRALRPASFKHKQGCATKISFSFSFRSELSTQSRSCRSGVRRVAPTLVAIGTTVEGCDLAHRRVRPARKRTFTPVSMGDHF